MKCASSLGLSSVYLTTWLDAMGNMMIMPLLPFLAMKLNASPGEIGFMQSLFALMQVLGTLIMGILADRVGEKAVLLCCLLSSTLSLIAFGLADSFTQLLLFRGLSGFFSGTVGVCQSLIAGHTSPEDRPQAMAKQGAAFGLGLCVGPGVGGLLAPFGFSTVAFSAAGLTFFNLILAMFSLPTTEKAQGSQAQLETVMETQGEESAQTKGNLATLSSLVQTHPQLGVLYAVNFAQNFAFGAFIATTPLYFHDAYNFTGAKMGHIFFIAGVVMVLFQMCVTKKAVTSLGERVCLMIGSSMRCTAGIALSIFYAPFLPYLMPTLNASGGALIQPCMATLTASMAPPQNRGLVLGCLQSLGSLGQFFGPTVGGTLYGYRHNAPFITAAVAQATCVLICAVGLSSTKPTPTLPEAVPPLLRDASTPRMTRMSSTSSLDYLNPEATSIPAYLSCEMIGSPSNVLQRTVSF